MVSSRTIMGTILLLLALLLVSMLLLPRVAVPARSAGEGYVDTVFDQNRVTRVDITMSDDDLQSMLDNPLAEENKLADVTVNGVTVKGVAVRTKGNSSLRSIAQNDETDRYSFKVDFDYYTDQSLNGLKKLNLNNNFSDASLMREVLSYEIMEAMGVPTPAYSYMYVSINGREWGLYVGVEAIEETYLARHFDTGTGDLYKPEGTGSDLVWISDDIDDYPGLNLKTNKNISNGQSTIRFLDAINNGGDLESVLDVDEALRYFAVNTALVNLDSYQGSMKHNYYLYEEDGVFSILPWDYNMSFGGFSFGGGMRGGMGQSGQGDAPGEGAAADVGGANGERAAAGVDVAAGDGIAAPRQQAGTAPGRQQRNMPAAAQDAGGGDDARRQERGFRGGMGMDMGGMMDSSANFMNESNINFSIETPVSGATLESRPLLASLLAVDEYKEKYYSYLEEIATTYFTEEWFTTKTANISALILPYVEADPTKFFTTEQFLQGVSGDNSLTAFAVKRSESILAQLSGDLVVEADTSQGFGGGGAPGIGMEGMQPPEGMQLPEGMQFPEGMEPSEGMQFPEGRQPPEGMQFPEGFEPGRGDGPGPWGGGPQGSAANNKTGYSNEFLLSSGVSIAVLAAGLWFAARFRRRRI